MQHNNSVYKVSHCLDFCTDWGVHLILKSHLHPSRHTFTMQLLINYGVLINVLIDAIATSLKNWTQHELCNRPQTQARQTASNPISSILDNNSVLSDCLFAHNITRTATKTWPCTVNVI